MINNEFDIIHNRRVPGDIKYKPMKANKDIIPMWIADMDFKAPNAVKETLQNLAKHNIWGYTETDEKYDNAVISWYKRRFGWDFFSNQILKMPGVMFAISASIRALTKPYESIIICQPVYYPFSKIITENERKLVVSELKLQNGRYEIEFDDFEDKIIKNEVKMFLLCSPHNPVGRVWSIDELNRIGEICIRHNVWIVSDEIHSDFVYSNHKHIPIATLSGKLAEHCITCTSPTKTFNLAGLQNANIVISNDSVRKKVYKTGLSTGYSNLNTAAIAATKAAYTFGEEWLNSLLPYLQNNISLVREFCDNTNGFINLTEPEGTYLLWLDCRNLKLNNSELEDLFLNKAGLRLHNGTIFGKGGEGFMRMNIAAPKKIVQEAIKRLSIALESFDDIKGEKI